jgi:hypothetical protein
MSRRYGSLTLMGALLAGAACGNAGADKVLSITATGRIEGGVYFDENGSGRPDGTDPGVPAVNLRVIAWGTRDTVARPVTASDGTFTTSVLPVGRYLVSVPPAELGDTVRVVQLEDSVVSLLPEGTATVTVGIGFPNVPIAGAKALPVGTKVFVEGVALTSMGVFGDTTTHVADISGAIRAVRVQRVTQITGDSVRLLGTVSTRAGEPVLDDVRVSILAFGRPLPPIETLTTGQAASADGGRLDAALARVENITIADTVTTDDGFVITADDGSGALEILLDADIAFDTAGLDPDVKIDVTGVLVPDGAGAWVLKARGLTDLSIL